MNNLTIRGLTGLVFVIIMAGALWLGQITFFLVMGFIIVTSQIEFYRLTDKLKLKTNKAIGVALGILIFALTFAHAKHLIAGKWLYTPALLIILVSLTEFLKKRTSPFQNIVYTVFGLIYIPVALSFSNYIVFSEAFNHHYNFQLLLSIFILIWTYDTFSYLTGKWIGKHKLKETLSPKKTMEGAVGGLITTLIIAGAISQFSGTLAMYHWLIISVIVSLTGTLGDLTESALKRTAHAKDSGSFMPGHGGILDRFDAALFAIPSVFIYLEIFIF